MAEGFLSSIAKGLGWASDDVAETPSEPLPEGLPIEKARVVPTQTIGSNGGDVIAGVVVVQDRKPELAGSRRFILYDEMVRDTSIVATGVRLFLNLLAGAEWTMNPAEDQEGNPRAQEIADLAYDMMFDMTTPWSTVVRKQAMYRFQGFAVQEWTAKKRADGNIGMMDVENRPQRTISRWLQDASGTVTAIVQMDRNMKPVELPRGKVIYTVDDTLTDSPEGLGLFRHLWPTADRLNDFLRLERIGFETDLRGIPIARAPMGELRATADAEAKRAPTPDEIAAAGGDVAVAQAKIRGQAEARRGAKLEPVKSLLNNHLRSEKLGAMLPSDTYQGTSGTSGETRTPSTVPKWGLELLTGDATSFDAMANSINRLIADLARLLGVEHLLLGADGAGSLALARSKVGTFYLTVTATLNELVEVFERDWLRPLAELNGWPEELIPSIGVAEIREADVEQVTSALANMANAGATLMPDDPAIGEVRDMLGLSRPPEDTMAEDAMLTSGGINPLNPEVAQTATTEPGLAKRHIIWSRRSQARRRTAAIKKFDPNQPRDPGGEGGGQWISTSGGTDGAKPEGVVADDMKEKGFKEFFAGSMIVDANGNPMPLFHGTVQDFSQFDHAYGGTNTGPEYGGTDNAFYFSPSRSETSLYIEMAQARAENNYEDVPDGRVMRAYINAKNPLILGEDGSSSVKGQTLSDLINDDAAAVTYAHRHGHDAIVWPIGNNVNAGHTVAALDPDQIWVAGVENTRGQQIKGR